jgi:hypothetical protein
VTYSVEGDMLMVGVLLCMCDYTHQGLLCVHDNPTVGLQTSSPGDTISSLHISLCVCCCVLGSMLEKADPGSLSETFGRSVERLNGRTDVLNVTLPFLFVFVVVS